MTESKITNRSTDMETIKDCWQPLSNVFCKQIVALLETRTNFGQKCTCKSDFILRNQVITDPTFNFCLWCGGFVKNQFLKSRKN